MTEIRIKRSSDVIIGFIASGHASDECAGENIYCAAVSAITQTAAIGLEEFADAEIKMHDAFLSVSVNKKRASDEKCQTIFKTMLLGLTSFAEANPGRIQIIEEVQ